MRCHHPSRLNACGTQLEDGDATNQCTEEVFRSTAAVKEKDGGMHRPSQFQAALPPQFVLKLITRNRGKWRLLLEVCVCVALVCL